MASGPEPDGSVPAGVPFTVSVTPGMAVAAYVIGLDAAGQCSE